MFSLRGAISLYTTANVFLLGLFVSPGLVAFFAGAERLARGFASLIGPFSQALFPRVNALLSIDRAKAESLVSKTAIILVVGAAGSSVGLILLAKPLVNIMLGPEFEESVVLFRILVCILPLIAIGNVYGIQWMLPLGIEKTMNVILFTAGVTNIVLVLTFVPAGGSRALSLIVVLVELGVATLICLVLIHRREFPRPRL